MFASLVVKSDVLTEAFTSVNQNCLVGHGSTCGSGKSRRGIHDFDILTIPADDQPF